MQDDQLVEVAETSSSMEAEIVRSRLEAEGIPAMVKGGGVDPYPTGTARVFVAASHEVQARLILEQAETVQEDDEAP